MNKFERLLIEEQVNKRNCLSDLKELRKYITSVMRDFEELGEKEFRKIYSRCEYSYEGLCYYRRLITKKIRIMKELYSND